MGWYKMENNFSISRKQAQALCDNILSKGSFLQFNKALAKTFGIYGALMIAELLWRQKKFESEGKTITVKGEEGYFYCTQSRIENEILLSPYQQREALRLLQKKGLISIKKIGQPAKNHYRIDYFLLLKNFSTSAKEICHNINKNKEIKRNTLKSIKGFSDENSETSFSSENNSSSKKEKTNILEKKNNSSSKEKENSSFEKNKFVEEFNNLPFPREHKDPSTKIYQKAVKYFKYLQTGKFAERCAVDKTFMIKNKLSLDEITHKFTDKEINETLNNLSLIFKEGYFPSTKDNLPKDLATLIYNERTGHSWFFKVYKNPPKPIKQIKAVDIKIEVPAEIEKQYKKLLADSGLSEDKTALKYCLQEITLEAKKMHNRLGDVYSHRSFSSYFGSKKNLKPFYQSHIDFLKTKNSISIDKLKVGSFAWKDFVAYVKKDMDYILNPDDQQLAKLQKEHEYHLERKASQARSAELQRQKELAENFDSF